MRHPGARADTAKKRYNSAGNHCRHSPTPEYQRNGVREYWLVDPLSQGVEILFLTGSGYERGRFLRSGEVLESRVLPGLRIPVAELFPDS